MRRAAVVAGVVVYALAWVVARAAAQVSPAAPEIVVNSYVEDAQRTPVSCRNGTGEVVVWQSDKQDGRGWGVYAQRYGPTGAPAGSEFRVHSHTSGNESHPAIACVDDGRFIIAWDSDHSNTTRGVFGQLFDTQGTAIGSELQINSDTLSDSVLPAVCSTADGSAVVTWQGYHATNRHDIFAQRLSSTGEPLGSEFRVNTHVESTQSRPAVGCQANGEFVVVWDSDVQDGADFGIFGQRYDRDGTPKGFEFQVSTTTVGSQQRPRVAVAPTAEFVVVWESRSQSGGTYGVFGQRFDASGPRGTEFRVGGNVRGDQSRPSVASDAHGDFVVVWANEQDGGQISGQRYTSGGTAIGPEFRVSGATESSARNPSVAASGPGDFTVAWQHREVASADDGIAARRFVVCGNGSIDPGEACDDGNLLDGDCCSASCEFEQAPNLRSDDHVCPNIGADALVCVATAAARVPCDDGDACTSDDACQYGVCVGGARLDCDDGTLCTTDSCRPQVGCLHAPNTLPCDDGNICTGPDTCRGGACRGGLALTCDDVDVCTDDACDPTRGCVHQPNTAPCDDGNLCTSSGRCDSGHCRGVDPVVCTPIDACHAAGICDPASGHCSSPPLPEGAACDDSSVCTVGDHCVAGACTPGPTGIPFLVKDINSGAKSSAPVELVSTGGRIFFRGDDGAHGRELWVSDGTAAATSLVADIRPGPTGSAPGALVALGDRVFFAATDAQDDRELWVSDGRSDGTRRVRDIGVTGSANPTLLVAAADHVFFVADDGAHGRELWRSDGTETGTVLLKDIRSGQCGETACDGAIADLTVVEGRLFFTAADGINGRELWTSDGSTAGTTMVADIRPGADGSQPAFLTAYRGGVVFAADDGEHGKELWHSGGSAESTAMIADIRPGECDGRPCSSSPSYLTDADDTLFFAVAGGHPIPPLPRGEHKGGGELWRSDGSGAGTHRVAAVPGLPYVRRALHSNLIFAAGSGVQTALWRSDGTSNGTRSLATARATAPAWPINLDGRVFFSGTDQQRGTELWSSDGTEAGTIFVHDINPTRNGALGGSSSPASLTAAGDLLFFSADDGEHGRELWALCR